MLLFTASISLLVLTGFALHVDDLFLDAYALLRRLRPRRLSGEELRQLRALPQKRLALLIPAWNESGTLERVLEKNLPTLAYENYSVFVGVYTNDPFTWRSARRLEQKFPQLSVVVNDRPGPSSPAQLLNEMSRQILAAEEVTGLRHEGFLLLGAQDEIHPFALLLLNGELERHDFLQLPLLAKRASWRQFAAGTYADETAELHTKELLARVALGASLPSPLVRSCLSRTLLQALLRKGGLFGRHQTEGYQLALEVNRLGFPARFLCAYRDSELGRDFLAVRKPFPAGARAAIDHKARWVAGIAFQGAARFGWAGSLAERYFLWRDRRGAWTTLFLGAVSSLFLLSAFTGDGTLPALPRWVEALALVNFALWLRRVAWRMHSAAWVHGWAYAALVPLRWPVANFVNSLAAWRGFARFRGMRADEKRMETERQKFVRSERGSSDVG